ncbi:NUDIX hydrolase [Methylopila henanensis]|uniref:NUDIX hydrolase n=1 Tax=Methylopila henanensis TaxID=873516 RepID=A0ABW4K9S2_9HYPH
MTSSDDRLHPTRPLLAASIACFRDGKVLVARRGKPPSDRLWSLPGGMVELGETLAAAALRELEEETGVTAEIVGLADAVDVIALDGSGAVERHVAVIAFAGRWRSGDGEIGPEAAEIAWVAPDGLAAMDTTPGLAAVVARAARLVS